MRLALSLIACVLTLAPASLRAQAPAEAPFVVEYYYKIRWGAQEEFLRLFRKNHLPILEAEQKLGRIREIRMEQPREHLPEEARWDYRVRIVFASLAAYDSPGLPDAELRRMYPDQATFDREEQRRFEILLAHWDVPVRPVSAP